MCDDIRAHSTEMQVALPIVGAGGALLGLWCAISYFTGRAFVEQAKYTVVRQHKSFELRRYAPSVHAVCKVDGLAPDQDHLVAANRGFRPLAGFIFGNNRAATASAAGTSGELLGGSRKVAMTSPVIAAPVGKATIAMTSPVVTSADAPDSYEVVFVMPSQYTSPAALPEPLDPRVTLRAVPEHYTVVASYNHARFPRGPAFHAMSAQLAADAAAAGYTLTRPGALATALQYDPPWTPFFMRRNEYAHEVAPPADAQGTAAQ